MTSHRVIMVDCKFVGAASLLYGEKNRGRFMVIVSRQNARDTSQWPIYAWPYAAVTHLDFSHCPTGPTLLSWQNHATSATLWYLMELFAICAGCAWDWDYDHGWTSVGPYTWGCIRLGSYLAVLRHFATSQPSISVTYCWENVKGDWQFDLRQGLK